MKVLSDVVLLPRPRLVRDGRGVCFRSVVAEWVREVGLGGEGYRVVIGEEGISVASGGEAGRFYATMTLLQLRRACGEVLPCGVIEDGPNFAVRGVMLDVSRDKVPTMATLRRLVVELAEWKFNRLELYTEHTFAYRNHREVWKDASPLTGEEIRELDAFCRERFIELVPNQNCFGHLARWLKHPRYRDLAETPDGHTAWGEWRDYPFSLNPLDPRSIALVEELLAELLPNFSSVNVNVGCDETVDLGQGRSKAECERVGKGRVYLDFLLKIYALTKRHGRRMHFWGDIILHHPELIPELPKDAVALVWGYEAEHPFAKECEAFARSGLEFFVCPGTSTWNALTGRTTNMIGNIRSAAEHGLRHGASGYLVTDWGDNGHWQPLPFSYPGIAAASGAAWCAAANDPAKLAAQLDAHVFRDAAGIAGRVVLELGDVYRKLSIQRANATNLFWLLRGADISKIREKTPASELMEIRTAVENLASEIPRVRMQRDDAADVAAEITLGAQMLELACQRGEAGSENPDALRDQIEQMRASWLRRNRPGGLEDSLAPLHARLAQETAD